MITADASLFLSYNHADNDYLGGEITRFVDEIANSYEFLYGNKLDVFIDSRSIQWGQQWEQELQKRIESCNIIMPAVTPRYLRSEACRKELFAFKSKVEAQPNNHIMSLIWQDYGPSRESSDIAANIIGSFQYESVEDLRDTDAKSPAYRNRAEALARRIREVITGNNSNALKVGSTVKQSDVVKKMGLAERLYACEQTMPAFTEAFSKLADDTLRLLSTYEKHPAPRNGKADDLLKWTLAIGAHTKEDVIILQKDISEAKITWEIMLEGLSDYVDFVATLATVQQGKQQAEQAYGMIVALRNTASIPLDEQSIMPILESLGLISPKLKPFGESLINVIDLTNDIKTSINQLEDKLQKVL